MGVQPDAQSLCFYILVVQLVLLLGFNSLSSAQQEYNGNSYICSDSGKESCSAYALYRAQANYMTPSQIATIFNAKPETIVQLNHLTLINEILAVNQSVIVQMTCICYNQTSYANLTHIIVNGDTFYGLATVNYENLATTTAVINANPTLNYTDLIIGTPMIFPARCGCPSLAQISSGVKSLVTYPVIAGDSTGEIAKSFGVFQQNVLTANELVGANSQIDFATTLLIPIDTSAPNYTAPVLPGAGPSNSSASAPPTSPSPGHSSNTSAIIGITVGVCASVAIFALAVCFLCLILKKRRRKGDPRRKDDTESPLVVGKGGSPSSKSYSNKAVAGALGDPLAGMTDLVDSDRPATFTYQELCDATNNFSEGSRLQGSVYRGILKGNVVAIKQMKGNMSEELKILCRVHHSNLIKLVGLCVKEAEHLYLVYEYAENGSLSDCLHTDFMSKNKLSTKSSSYLSWTTRVQIALDAACGLEYIHDYVSPSYVHKDVKSSNILLDSAFQAKIANFAMAKSGGNDMMTRHIAGTYGYMAPEYLQHGLVTTKADVFAFGVVLLELLSGDEAISKGGEERCLYSVIRPIVESEDPVESLKRWMDPKLGNNYSVDTALSIASLAKSCVENDPLQRPSMKDITFALSNCLNASLEWETSSVFASALAETPIEAR